MVRRALVSVSDKTGLVPFAKRLAALGVEILSTGGTQQRARRRGRAGRLAWATTRRRRRSSAGA